MFQENTRCTRHRQQIGIGGQCVLTERILLDGSRTVFRIVILDKGHGIALIAAIIGTDDTGIAELCPIIVVNGVAYCVAEGEVKDSTLYGSVVFCGVQPFDTVAGIAIPELTNRIGGLCVLVVKSRKLARIAFHHIVAEANILQVFQ